MAQKLDVLIGSAWPTDLKKTYKHSAISKVAERDSVLGAQFYAAHTPLMVKQWHWWKGPGEPHTIDMIVRHYPQSCILGREKQWPLATDEVFWLPVLRNLVSTFRPCTAAEFKAEFYTMVRSGSSEPKACWKSEEVWATFHFFMKCYRFAFVPKFWALDMAHQWWENVVAPHMLQTLTAGEFSVLDFRLTKRTDGTFDSKLVVSPVNLEQLCFNARQAPRTRYTRL